MSDSRLDALRSGLDSAIDKGKTLSLKKSDGLQAQQSIDASIKEIHNMESDMFNQQTALNSDLKEARGNLADLIEYNKNCPADQKETIAAAIESAKNQISILEAKCNELERTQNQIIAKDNQLSDQQCTIYEDNKLTNDELVKTDKMIDDLSRQIEERKAEIKATKEYADNAGGACQKGIDVIFGSDGSKRPKQPKSTGGGGGLPAYDNSPSKSETSNKKTSGGWMTASRDWNQNLF